MVHNVDGARDELAGLGVRARDEQHRVVHHVELEARGDEARDVRGRGHEDLAREVAALLAAYELVLEVDRRGALSQGLVW